ncbi:transcriptional repressor TCF25-domain-containing protein [Cyathus striatus]|nr:transcriptional repressor TCF25-domain-containing protein [Cyathus striatus]
MPPRLNKRQQRELEELEALSGSLGKDLKVDSGEEEEEFPERDVKTGGGFSSLLMNDMAGDDDEESEEETSKVKGSKSKKSKKKKKKPAQSASTADPTASPSPQPSKTTAPVPEPPSISKSERKALKKARAKEKQKEAAEDEVDKALKELGVSVPTASPAAAHASSSTGTTLPALLSVSLQHLDADAELRKFFGSRVVQSSSAAETSTNFSRRQAAALKAQKASIKSNLTKPKPGWWNARGREGLSLRLLTHEEVEARKARRAWTVGDGGDESDRWWTVEYSKKYKAFTKRFMATVLSGDPQGFWDLISSLPWHADTLLQLSEVYRHREEHAPASDFLDRAMFTYERAFVGSFTFASGLNRLDFDQVENRPFFLAIHRVVVDLNRRGCARTSFEFAKLLYGLDPWDDPHGALLHLDMLALRAGTQKWLLDAWAWFDARRSHQLAGEKEKGAMRMDPCLLPGWAYARALGMWMNEEAKGDKEHEKSTEVLKQAILDFPSVVPLLADKIEASIPGHVRAHKDFKIETDGMGLKPAESILHLLSHLYAQRSSSIWKQPAHLAWFQSTVSSTLPPSMPSSLPPSTRRQSMLDMYTSSETLRHAVYRHVMVLESTYRRLFSFIPREVLQAKSLSCDPLPPVTMISEYNETYFADVIAFESTRARRRPTRRQQELEGRQLAQMVPDLGFREQLRAFFDAHPALWERFPGGIVHFAQAIAQLPPEMVEDMMMMQVIDNDQDEVDGGDIDMPGGFAFGADEVGDRGVEGDVENGDHEEDEEFVDEEGEQTDEEDEEEISPMPRAIRNILGRFFGRTPQPEEDSSSDEEPADTLGVD